MAGGDTGELILAIDAGTQSIRAALVDLTGRIREIVKTPVELMPPRHPGWAEQSADYYWDVLCRTTRECLSRQAGLRERVRAVALTTLRATVVDVDENGNAVRPVLLWLDERKADERLVLSPLWRGLAKGLGLSDLVIGAARDGESNWIKQNEPEVWAKVHKHLFLSGYFTHRLTGEFADSVGNIAGYVPFNVKKGEWCGRFDVKWKLFPIEREKLPRLVPPTGTLGEITAEASAQTGIPRGLPLIAAANDKACEILGAGCLTPADICASFGTICTIDAPGDRYVEIRPMWPPYPAAVPGHYYTEVSVMRGAWMITWFKEEFGLPERQEAMARGVTPEELLDELVRDVPPGSMGLVLRPDWTPSPGQSPAMRGSVIGFCDVHKRAHLYRAILEGLAYALKDGATLLQRKHKTRMERLRVSGGGSQSDSVMQICADVFNMPAERPRTHETSAVGAAIDAAVGLGVYADFPKAVAAMTGTGAVFTPIPANVETYAALYERVYRRMEKRLLPLFEETRAITGYPR